MDKLLEKALRYVRENRTWSDAQEELANERMSTYRCNMSFADPNITDKISDLLEEFGDDNDLPEGWWMEYGDADDIYYML